MIEHLIATVLATVALAVGATPVQQTVGAAVADAGAAALGNPQIGTAISAVGTSSREAGRE